MNERTDRSILAPIKIYDLLNQEKVLRGNSNRKKKLIQLNLYVKSPWSIKLCLLQDRLYV
jgi:hypothetical protein